MITWTLVQNLDEAIYISAPHFLIFLFSPSSFSYLVEVLNLLDRFPKIKFEFMQNYNIG